MVPVKLDRMKKFHYSFTSDKFKIRDISHWCTEQYGPKWDPIHNKEGSWSYRWNVKENNLIFYFCEEKQAILYMLRWSE